MKIRHHSTMRMQGQHNNNNACCGRPEHAGQNYFHPIKGDCNLYTYINKEGKMPLKQKCVDFSAPCDLANIARWEIEQTFPLYAYQCGVKVVL